MRGKGILIFCFIMLMISGVAYGGGFWLEVKGMYFQPKDQNFKHIYGNGSYRDWMCYGGEMGITIFKGVAIWAGGHYFNKRGKLTFTKEETEMTIMPIYGGIKFRSSRAGINPYIGVGVGYFRYKEDNPIGSVEDKSIGYIGQAGLTLKIGVAIIDFQISYTLCKVKPTDIEADLGGFYGGIGIGFEF